MTTAETSPGISLAELTTMNRAAAAFRARHGRRCTTPASTAGFSVLITAWTVPVRTGRDEYEKTNDSHWMQMVQGPTA
jgi:hypothetical protein